MSKKASGKAADSLSDAPEAAPSDCMRWDDDVTPEAVEQIQRKANEHIEGDDWSVIAGPAW